MELVVFWMFGQGEGWEEINSILPWTDTHSLDFSQPSSPLCVLQDSAFQSKIYPLQNLLKINVEFVCVVMFIV